MFRQCFVVISCLLSGRSAIRWAEWDVQTVFCGELVAFECSVSGRMGGLGCSVFCGEQLPFGRSVSGPVSGLGCSASVLL
jgi:hypothetical protein